MWLWSSWIETLESTLQLLAGTFGVSIGLALILLTLALRIVLLPVSWTSAYRGCIHQRRLKRLQPDLQRIRDKFRNDPNVLAQKTIALYKERNLSIIESSAFLGALIQMPVLLGMFQLLREGVSVARFLWIESLAKPDFWIAVLAGVTTAMMMAANPELPEQTRMFMIVLPSVIALVFALKFASALAVYWVTSNLFTAVHTAAVHYVIARQIRNGSISL